ncbi:SH2 domain-containing adapter protein F isoform X1 [Clarias gariepinus]|uniref:SH2 domain-containing adapter protein F isoform X1 n=1 Tax=Clarias gariepinus TaxID=13013 RepID=UPI00234C7DB2|nr:SH2 domain-containing adapter protein F isoform X1 [Clarias gariepinus]
MAKWFKEHLGFKSAKASPPAPPRPDYRHCHAAAAAAAYQHAGSGTGGAGYPSPAQPDILAAYKLQKELDFEDPYAAGANTPFSGAALSEVKYVSPKHRLIKVETLERSPSAGGGGGGGGGGSSSSGSSVTAATGTTGGGGTGGSGSGSGANANQAAAGNTRSPTSPAAEHEPKQDKVIILEDYADPFDAADQAGGTQSSVEKPVENDGYMEPYEAQKMMAEIRGSRGVKDGPSRQLPLYDTPYEPAENGGDSDPMCSRESRLPQDDERPPEEYDQPWEWKKERISKAFAVEIKVIKDLPWPPPVGQLSTTSPLVEVVEAPPAPPQASQLSPGQSASDCEQHHQVQFEGAEKGRMSPTKDGKSRPPQRHSSGCLVNVKMSSVEQCMPMLGERIDPTMPLESQFWYHGAISRTDAESLLRLCKEASYLVRNSETSKNDFSLSLKSSQGFMHMKLSRTKDNKYILGQNSCLFDSVPEIINFYSSRKLPIKGAEHMSLLYPVAIRTL